MHGLGSHFEGANRHYVGSTVDLDARIAQHERGHTHTTKRLARKTYFACGQRTRDARRINER
ncbi:MAG: GIY-YIG nuclease family protein [Nitrospirota bacterium]